MARINGITAFSRGRNAGKSSVTFDPSIHKGLLLAPYGTVLTAAQLADIQNTLISGVTEDAFKDRWVHVSPFESFDDKSEAPQQQTLGYGRKIFTDRGKIEHEYTLLEGGWNYYTAILWYKKKQASYVAFPYDDQGVLYGVKALDADGAEGMGGRKLSEIFVYDAKNANRGAVPEYRLALSYANNNELNEDAYMLKTGFDIATALEGIGVQDVELKDVTPVGASAGVKHIAVTAGGGAIDLVNTLQSAIAVSGPWKPTNGVVGDAKYGNAITITSVALNAAKTAVIITLDTSDADYPAVGADKYVNLDLASVSALAALDLKYYEVIHEQYPFKFLAT